MSLIAAIFNHFLTYNITIIIGRWLISHKYIDSNDVILIVFMPNILFTMILNSYLFNYVFIPFIIHIIIYALLDEARKRNDANYYIINKIKELNNKLKNNETENNKMRDKENEYFSYKIKELYSELINKTNETENTKSDNKIENNKTDNNEIENNKTEDNKTGDNEIKNNKTEDTDMSENNETEYFNKLDTDMLNVMNSIR